MADLTSRTRYVAFPALEMQELADRGRLGRLNEVFMRLARERGIRCSNYVEQARTLVGPGKLKYHIVPPEYAGELYHTLSYITH